MLATTRKPEKEELLKGNGADHVLIDDGNLAKKVKSIYPNGVEKVLELVGASTLNDLLYCTALGGTVCMAGMLSEQWAISDFAPMEYIPATVYLTIYDSGQVSVDGHNFQQFISDVETGTIQLNISKSFTLSEIAAAHQLMDSNSAGGKIVVTTGI